MKDTRYSWAYIFGAVCPARDVGAALVMPGADAEAMNKHLTEISSQAAAGRTAGIAPVGEVVQRNGRFPRHMANRMTADLRANAAQAQSPLARFTRDSATVAASNR